MLADLVDWHRAQANTGLGISPQSMVSAVEAKPEPHFSPGPERHWESEEEEDLRHAYDTGQIDPEAYFERLSAIQATQTNITLVQ